MPTPRAAIEPLQLAPLETERGECRDDAGPDDHVVEQRARRVARAGRNVGPAAQHDLDHGGQALGGEHSEADENQYVDDGRERDAVDHHFPLHDARGRPELDLVGRRQRRQQRLPDVERRRRPDDDRRDVHELRGGGADVPDVRDLLSWTIPESSLAEARARFSASSSFNRRRHRVTFSERVIRAWTSSRKIPTYAEFSEAAGHDRDREALAVHDRDRQREKHQHQQRAQAVVGDAEPEPDRPCGSPAGDPKPKYTVSMSIATTMEQTRERRSFRERRETIDECRGERDR